jgi:hypothetical protein
MDRPKVSSQIYSYECSWATGRFVRRAHQALRYELTANADRRFPIRKNTDSAAEALALARLYAGLCMPVQVRDRARRRSYLTEAMLEERAAEELQSCPPVLEVKSAPPTRSPARSRSAA